MGSGHKFPQHGAKLSNEPRITYAPGSGNFEEKIWRILQKGYVPMTDDVLSDVGRWQYRLLPMTTPPPMMADDSTDARADARADAVPMYTDGSDDVGQ